MTNDKHGPNPYFVAFVQYLFFALQFLLATTWINHILVRLGLSFLNDFDSSDRTAIYSAVMFVPYIATVHFYFKYFPAVRNRYLLQSRMIKFREMLDEILDYQERMQISRGIERLASLKEDVAKELLRTPVRVMIDLLITDYKEAMLSLFPASEIRVSVYTLSLIETGSRKGAPALKRIATTEFKKDGEPGTAFHYDAERQRYVGFCGKAYSTQRAQSGTFHPFPFRRMLVDHDFHRDLVQDETRSFLCMPIKDGSFEDYDDPANTVSAVLCVDSDRRFDFVLSRHDMELINQASRTIFSIILYYLPLYGKYYAPLGGPSR